MIDSITTFCQGEKE